MYEKFSFIQVISGLYTLKLLGEKKKEIKENNQEVCFYSWQEKLGQSCFNNSLSHHKTVLSQSYC